MNNGPKYWFSVFLISNNCNCHKESKDTVKTYQSNSIADVRIHILMCFQGMNPTFKCFFASLGKGCVRDKARQGVYYRKLIVAMYVCV